MSDKQIIFVLDLDGTIIGDCSYQCDIYNIDNISKKNNKDTLLNCYKPDSKLIRPYFKYFFTKIKKIYPNSLFYIYTASEKIWAHKEIGLIENMQRENLTAIEEALGFERLQRESSASFWTSM